MPKFSIITSAHLWAEFKEKQLTRARNSVKNQTFKDYEHVLIDDGSIEDLKIKDAKLTTPHLERINSLRDGMKEAAGEWFVFLDADDELVSYYLEAVNQMIEANPKEKMFNFGSFHINGNYSATIRGAFKPERKEVGHEVFGGGNIVNGTFVFHHSIYQELGGYPENQENVDATEINYGDNRPLKMSSPYDFSAAAQLEFPEIRQYFTVGDGEPSGKVIKELGNPWGNDFYLFYKYTRKHHSIPYDIPLYIVHHEGKLDGQQHKIS